MRALDVLCVGETIVDMLPEERGRLRDVSRFHKVVGGAPGNVSVGLARLGLKSGLMCKVGEDEFGAFLREEIEREGVDVELVTTTREAMTGMTFVSLRHDGERSFTGMQGPSADQFLKMEDLDADLIGRARVALFGTNQLLTERPRSVAMRALELARERCDMVIVDPNVREHLWSDRDEMWDCCMEMVRRADVVKLNDEELELLSRGEGARALWERELSGARALVTTHADGGARVIARASDGGLVEASATAWPVEVVDTTGAGDGFVAGLLASMCRQEPDADAPLREVLGGWSQEQWSRALSVGCFVGSRTCAHLGATPGLPYEKDVDWGA